MTIPAFNVDGDLPEGLHRVTLAEALLRFGQESAHRKLLGERLRRIYQLAHSTGHLARFVVYGSFVTEKPQPDDVDIVMLMEDSFELDRVAGEAAIVFRHQDADAHFGASIFWSCRSSAIGGEQAMLEYWQARREGGKRGIVEIVEVV